MFQPCLTSKNCITPGVYAIVGAAAMLGGLTRGTVSLVVIMFEVTGGLLYILPIMVGVLFSKVVGELISRNSIYEEHIQLNNYPLLDAKDEIDPNLRVSNFMSKDLLYITMHGHTVASLYEHIDLLQSLEISGCPVVTSAMDKYVVGYITRDELEAGLAEACKDENIHDDTRCYFAMLELRFPKNEPFVDMGPYLHPTPVQITENTPLHRIHDMFKKLGLRYCLVTRFGKLVGILTKKDILEVCRAAENVTRV